MKAASELAQTGSPAFRAIEYHLDLTCLCRAAVEPLRHHVIRIHIHQLDPDLPRLLELPEMAEGRREISARPIGIGFQEDAFAEQSCSRHVAADEEISHAEKLEKVKGRVQRRINPHHPLIVWNSFKRHLIGKARAEAIGGSCYEDTGNWSNLLMADGRLKRDS
jgi:hypothetical protein